MIGFYVWISDRKKNSDRKRIVHIQHVNYEVVWDGEYIDQDECQLH